MITNCCNPDCRAPFDYCKGRLIRCCKVLPFYSSFLNEHPVEHYWLCKECSEHYVLEFEFGTNLKLRTRSEVSSRRKVSNCVAAV